MMKANPLAVFWLLTVGFTTVAASQANSSDNESVAVIVKTVSPTEQKCVGKESCDCQSNEQCVYYQDNESKNEWDQIKGERDLLSKRAGPSLEESLFVSLDKTSVGKSPEC